MIIAYGIITGYVLLILSFYVAFNKVKINTKKAKVAHVVSFTIIIPFRNEALTLPSLIASINALQYSKDKFEILLVDDASTDDSFTIIKEQIDSAINYQVLKNNRTSASPKKDALTVAIKQAKNPWIITTDADCVLPKFWLQSFSCFIATNTVKMIAAPVAMQYQRGLWKQFQTHDFLALQGVTIGAFGLQNPFLCNGANLCYEKEAFLAVNGFEGNDMMASGDDVFLLEKINKQYPNHVYYLKDKAAIVTTMPVATFSDLVQQRVRWASKSRAYKSKLALFSGVILVLFLAVLFYLIITAQFQLVFLAFLAKFFVDLLLLVRTSQFFNQKQVIRTFIWSSFVYPFFTMYIAVLALFKKYKWKGRLLE